MTTLFVYREERQGHEERQRVISGRTCIFPSRPFVPFAVPPFFLPRRTRRARRRAKILQDGTEYVFYCLLRSESCALQPTAHCALRAGYLSSQCAEKCFGNGEGFWHGVPCELGGFLPLNALKDKEEYVPTLWVHLMYFPFAFLRTLRG
jgi:hypothetical protein